ncbi:hypothetical protein AMAG_02990 [Allomyces macrogynus ATCC 38327]|uniref:Glycylpeptide N-tetradecanoyltransferase n=1 Tax=Allomyces macrogynus (strain ATCC 38327) TaxID=578462 RepID=A0A0L0S3X9_ALLM3|nr:hypothetical protein AMAG_02990 [Allomyces macrogynus ATCC 38327]|eukprot:KNE57257.1 hypothetical protein AMAG_02990 [Allomyces macrogynus ATCC 38327]
MSNNKRANGKKPQDVDEDDLLATVQRIAALSAGQEGAPKPPPEHKFWRTQPVPQTHEEQVAIEADGPLEPNKPRDQVRQTPLPLPAGFEWCEVDITDENELDQVYTLLFNNYVEDTEGNFRFGYPKDLLTWALKPPGWKKTWHVGVRVSASRKLVAFISGIPARMAVNKTELPMVEINFLCVLKKLRSKRLAPVLIKEITRRCNLEGIFQALYTAGTALPGSVGACRYWHRSLNVRKLVETGFSYVPIGKTFEQQERRLRVGSTPKLDGIREMTVRDVPQVKRGLEEYNARFGLHPHFSEEEIAHWMVPRKGVVHSYVVENKEGKITHFFSFYRIPSKVLNHPKHTELNAAYSFYYFYPEGKTAIETSNNLVELFTDGLHFADKTGHDVFNCLELMENSEVLDACKFARGDGVLHYYLYNWRCKPFPGDKLGVVLM